MRQKLSWLNVKHSIASGKRWLLSTWEPFKIVSVGLLAVVSTVLLVQFLRWGNYMTDATYYELRTVVFGQNPDDLVALASIAQAMGENEKANRYLLRTLEIDREHSSAQANLGISYAGSGEWEKSQLYLKSYLANGGGSFEALYWYGKAFLKLGELEQGISWLYNSLFINPTYETAAQELFEWLIQLGRKSEAFSLLESITGGESRSFLGTYQRQQTLWERSGEDSLENGHEVRLPSFDGTHFYMPISMVQGRSAEFLLIRQGREYSTIDLDILLKRRIPFEVVTSKKSKKKSSEYTTVRLPQVKIADWLFKDLKVRACSGCPNIMGADLVKKFYIERWEEKGVNFIYLRRKR